VNASVSSYYHNVHQEKTCKYVQNNNHYTELYSAIDKNPKTPDTVTKPLKRILPPLLPAVRSENQNPQLAEECIELKLKNHKSSRALASPPCVDSTSPKRILSINHRKSTESHSRRTSIQLILTKC
jgi:hypothetical protein